MLVVAVGSTAFCDDRRKQAIANRPAVGEDLVKR